MNEVCSSRCASLQSIDYISLPNYIYQKFIYSTSIVN